VRDLRRAALLHGVAASSAGGDVPRGVALILKHREERWDGAGTPDHLKEDGIPLGARILAVATAYADMVTGGPGSPMLYYLDAKSQLRRNAGAAFDPEVVQAFCRVVDSG
jgi:response regulator RpfG family c-di-GMP phosphodiesterase